MDVIIKGKKLEGNLIIPPSKAVSHRAIICACLAEGRSIIKNVNMCDDVKNTINILKQIVPIQINENTLVVDGGIKEVKNNNFDINESASTLRFLLPILSFFADHEIIFNLKTELSQRIGDEYSFLYDNRKEKYEFDKNTITTFKFPQKTKYKLNTKTTSQAVTGVLFLSPFLGKSTTIKTSNNNSAGYIDLTIEVMKNFGVEAKRKNKTISINKNQKFKPTNYIIPPDASFAVNVAVMNKLGSNIKIINDTFDTNEPDYLLYKKIINNTPSVLDVKKNPDSVFAFSMLSLVSDDKKIINTTRLQKKETNREKAIQYLFESFKANTPTFKHNKIVLKKTKFAAKGEFESKKDHRLCFVGIIISTVVEEVVIKNFECVSKSYSNILEDFLNIGLNFTIKQNSS